MKDKEIRKILIEYLKSQGTEMRIYQEKSIGNSICDLMTVTDKLTGYEIKSDSDNYQRLNDQVLTYDRFFDFNYIVIGQVHSSSAASKVPYHWGIICIESDNVTVFRKAKLNKRVSRRSQLSVLWKLELKNILIKNNMPLYAQKEKGYISDRIAEQVDDETLQKQIAYELLHRDYSVYEDATDYSVYTIGIQTGMPAREIIDMLSENGFEDITLDKWIEIYRTAHEMHEKKEALFVKKPSTPRTPHDIPYTDIEVSLGAPWIDLSIINEFIGHIMYDKDCNPGFCKYEPVTGNWYIGEKRSAECKRNTNLTVKYGTDRYNALFIIEATLNLREIKLRDFDGEYEEDETVAALEKQKKIDQEFKDWIWLDEDRIWQVEEAYNKMLGKYGRQNYDGSKLVFEGMNETYELYPYQKDAVQKILNSKNTLLAFDVGAGKTYIMIAAAMKMRKDGISRRNMFVVPNHIVGQWEKIFTDLYPKAKILAIEPKMFKPEMRQKVFRQIKEGDYDGVIIAYSCFEMIPVSERLIFENMNRQINRIEAAIYSLRKSDFWQREVLNKEKQRLAELTQDLIKEMSYTGKEGVLFEDLDITTLFLDEAHNYKNLPIKTQLKNLNGINTKGSSKCLDMLQKIRHIQNSENGRGAVFATGTPLCNSISDAYVMQFYLQYEEMENSHLDCFDNWVKTFAKPEQLLEIDVDTSKYRMIRKFSRFHNLPELSRMFSQIAVFYAIDKDGALPQFDGYTDIVIHSYDALEDYMKTLCERTEEIRTGKIDRKFDNMLKVSIDGRKAALDLKLVGCEQPYDGNSKVFNCVENVSDIYYKYEKCTQLIFCDYSTPKGEDFSVYKDLKLHLTEKGIPEKEIAFIHSYNTESRKLELFRKFNAGEIRVLIGSTFKLGIGANVQVKLKAIHHLDVPWRPADMVQREGRIIRRGNENENVLIYRYITEGSFDSYSWQVLETKQRFISQFLSGSSYQRSVSDLEDNVLSYAEVKALALSEPLMKQLAEKENEVKSLRIVIAKENENIAALKDELKKCTDTAIVLYKRLPEAAKILSRTEKYDKSVYNNAYKEISDKITPDFLRGKTVYKSFSVLCFIASLPDEQDEKKPVIVLCHGKEKYTVEMGDSPNGNARRVINFIKSYKKVYNELTEEETKIKNRIASIDKILNSQDNSNQKKLSEAEKELDELKRMIKATEEPD